MYDAAITKYMEKNLHTIVLNYFLSGTWSMMWVIVHTKWFNISHYVFTRMQKYFFRQHASWIGIYLDSLIDLLSCSILKVYKFNLTLFISIFLSRNYLPTIYLIHHISFKCNTAKSNIIWNNHQSSHWIELTQYIFITSCIMNWNINLRNHISILSTIVCGAFVAKKGREMLHDLGGCQ